MRNRYKRGEVVNLGPRIIGEWKRNNSHKFRLVETFGAGDKRVWRLELLYTDAMGVDCWHEMDCLVQPDRDGSNDWKSVMMMCATVGALKEQP